MIFDLRRALLAKEERESARLMDFEFRLRARTFRLLAVELGCDPETVVRLVAMGDDDVIIEHLQRGRPDLNIAELFATALRKAQHDLRIEIGDPTPHRLA